MPAGAELVHVHASCLLASLALAWHVALERLGREDHMETMLPHVVQGLDAGALHAACQNLRAPHQRDVQHQVANDVLYPTDGGDKNYGQKRRRLKAGEPLAYACCMAPTSLRGVQGVVGLVL